MTLFYVWNEKSISPMYTNFRNI